VNSQELYQEFINKRRNSGLSPRTIEAYNYSILPFVGSCAELPCTETNVESYIYDNSWSQAKRAFVYRHLRVFLRWYSRHYKQDNPILDVLKPRTKLEPVRYLTKEEIIRLYQKVYPNKKHRAIILTLLDTGIRVGELLSIKICNLDHDILQVTGKSGPRTVAISPSVNQLLKEIAPTNSGKVFGNMDRHTVYRIVSGYLEDMGFDGKRGPHTLRHTFAVHALRNGMDIISVSQTMGHKTIAMTQQYLRLAQGDITESHQKYSPLNLLFAEVQE